MVKNYLIISLRNILRNKLFTFINIFGLSIGIATSILIYLYVIHELSYDKNQPKYERIYRIVSNTPHENKVESEAITPNPFIPALRNEMTQLEAMTRIIYLEEGVAMVNNQKYKMNNLMYIEPQFFDLFSVEWLVGSPSVFQGPDVAVLSESTAKKLFGSIDVLNKPLNINGKNSFTVRGVIKDNELTNIPFNILLAYEGYSKLDMPFSIDDWGVKISGFQSFVTLRDRSELGNVEKLINEISNKNTPDKSSKSVYSLQPLAKIRTDVVYGNSNLNGYTNPIYLISSAMVGFFILFLGCVNYINLTLSMLIKRNKEIGIRKVNGAVSKNINESE